MNDDDYCNEEYYGFYDKFDAKTETKTEIKPMDKLEQSLLKLMNSYKECKELVELQGTLLKELREEKAKLIKDYSSLSEDYSDLVNDYYNLKNKHHKPHNDNTPLNQFTPKELKIIRFGMHPDKHGGKYTDLFRKINDMVQ